jgi:hypothetical protein
MISQRFSDTISIAGFHSQPCWEWGNAAPRKKRGRTRGLRIVVVAIIMILPVLLSDCVTVPRYPQHTEIQDLDALPIDGEWGNDRGLAFRISRGKMYTLVNSSDGIPAGSVMVRDIFPSAPGRYQCKKESYNKSTLLLDFGPGEIRLILEDTMELQAFPNPKTGLGHEPPLKLRRIRLDDERAYRQELAAMRNEASEKEAPGRAHSREQRDQSAGADYRALAAKAVESGSLKAIVQVLQRMKQGDQR